MLGFTQQNLQIVDENSTNSNETNKKEKPQQLARKPKRKPLIFQPFASFEATEITVQSLKRGIINQKTMERAHSLEVIGIDL